MNPYHYHGHDDRLYNLEIVYEHTNGDVTWLCPKCGDTLRLGEDVSTADYPQHLATSPKAAIAEPIDNADAQAVSWLGRAMAELAGACTSAGS
jgi:hypothetical protein